VFLQLGDFHRSRHPSIVGRGANVVPYKVWRDIADSA